MTKEERQVEAKLRELAEAAHRNQRLLRKAFINYEDLIAQKVRLEENMEALQAFKEKQRRSSLNGFK